MGSHNDTGGWLPGETLGAGHRAPVYTPGAPLPESDPVDGEEMGPDRDVSHVTLKVSELRRLLHPPSAAES
jgi:hypothetical protein